VEPYPLNELCITNREPDVVLDKAGFRVARDDR
jgi:hypothetical protein